MGIALPAAIAGRLHTHQARIQAVLHVSFEDTVFDKDRFRGRRALVIDGERSAPRGDGPVIDDGHAGRGHAFTDPSAEGARALAVEIAFEPVSDCLVEEHAGPAGPEQDGHFARRRRFALEVHQCLRQGFVDCAHPHALVDDPVVEIAAAATEGAAFAPAVFLGHDRNVEANERADILRPVSVRADDLDHVPLGGEAGGYLRHPGIARAGRRIDRLEQPDLLGEAQRIERIVGGVEMPVGPLGRRGHRLRRRVEQPQGLAGPRDRGRADFVGMGKAGHLSRHAAQAEARIARVVRGLQSPVVEGEALARAELEVEFAVVAFGQQP